MKAKRKIINFSFSQFSGRKSNETGNFCINLSSGKSQMKANSGKICIHSYFRKKSK